MPVTHPTVEQLAEWKRLAARYLEFHENGARRAGNPMPSQPEVLAASHAISALLAEVDRLRALDEARAR